MTDAPLPAGRPERGGRRRRSRGRSKSNAPRKPPPLRLRRLDRNRFALAAPSCARDREEDLDEVRRMIIADEREIARDELLYLVADCRAFLAAHNLLGELALELGDVPLARGHYGFAYEVGLESLGDGFQGILPAGLDYNSEFFLAGRGLARCLIATGRREEGRGVLQFLARLDPREADVRTLLDELDEQERTGALPPPVVSDEGEEDDPDEE